jgi:hypothetical protein
MALAHTRFSWLVAAWLMCQVMAVAVAPLIAGSGVFANDVAVTDQCECPGNLPGQMCPMHDTHSGRNHDDGTECVVRSAAAPLEATLFALSLTPGLVVQVQTIDAGLDEASIIACIDPVLSHALLPDAPPPRS